LARWQTRMESTSLGLTQVNSTLNAFLQRRGEGRRMVDSVAATLTRLSAQGVPPESEGLLRAAADTYEQARAESAKSPANWLLVGDLLADVAACTEQIENPSRVRYQPVRYWVGYQDSPASDALEMMYAASMSSDSGSSSSSSDAGWSIGDSGGGGGDSGGGFGGGDSGGGGSSSDY